ncbi:MAG TPA: ABC transporter substrate-binding protein [Candidatus Sulfotelmatobacter sp.]|nr:ABC transporter substrate-binding protein [Candidatus Sulfotelmatobacter sp.]
MIRRLLAVVAAAASTLALTSVVVAAPPGALRVASDISYAPLEFRPAGSSRVEGFDYDLAQALGARLHERIDFANHDFSTLLPGLERGRFDLVVSALSDTRTREAQVTFVDYFLSGTGILTRAGNPAHLWNLASLCGHRVSVEAGTSGETAARAQSARCAEIGLGSIALVTAPTDEAALAAFTAGKTDAHLSDYPVVAYLARTLGEGKAYEVIGRPFDVVPFGIAVAKSNRALLDDVRGALLALVRDGTYDRLLRKWNLEEGALRSAPIDAGTKFQQ